MSEMTEPERQSWWTTLPGVLTALTGLIGAITALYLAIMPSKVDPCKALPVDDRPAYCLGSDQ
jgi:hypothetical protein